MAASGTRPSTSWAACCSAPDSRRRRRYRRHHDRVDEGRRRLPCLCLRGAGVQRVPTRARLRADGGLRDCPRDASSRLQRVGAIERLAELPLARRGAPTRPGHPRPRRRPRPWLGLTLDIPRLPGSARRIKEHVRQDPRLGDRSDVRRTAAHTQRLRRRFRRGSALRLRRAPSPWRSSSSGLERRDASPPDQVGHWSAPVAWPLVAVHMSLEPTGRCSRSTAWDDAPELRAVLGPARDVRAGSVRAQPLLRGHVQLADGRTLIVGGHVSADDGLADTTIFDPTTEPTSERRTCRSVAGIRPRPTGGRTRPRFAGDNIVQDRPAAASLLGCSVNSLPEIYNPKTNTWTDLTAPR